MSDYPEDIRQYDDDPRSPFYVEPPEDFIDPDSTGDDLDNQPGTP